MAYAFPELDISEIPHILTELFNLQVTESFLKKPEPTQWQKMLAHMLCVITECPEDSFLKQPSLAAEFEYLELHTDSIPVMHLVLVTQNVLKDIGCHDFSVGDIFTPISKRVKRICSGIVNFVRFKQMRLPELEQMKADNESEKEAYVSLQNENEQLKQRINDIKRQRAEQEPELNKIKEEVKAAYTRVNELMQKKILVEKTITNAKTSVTENVANADGLRSQLLNRKSEVDMMSQKIVHSPTKVKAEQENLNQQVEMLKDTLYRKQQRLGELNKQIDNYQVTGVSAEKGLVILEAISASVNKENELLKEYNQLEDKFQDLKHQEKELNAKKSKFQERNQSKHEKLAKLSYQHQSKISVMKEQLELLKNDKEVFAHKQDSNAALKEDLMHFKKRLETECKNTERLVEDKVNSLQDLYSQLLNLSDVSNTSIGANWEKTRKTLV